MAGYRQILEYLMGTDDEEAHSVHNLLPGVNDVFEEGTQSLAPVGRSHCPYQLSTSTVCPWDMELHT